MRRQDSPSDPEERISVLYFAGRPVAQLEQVSGASTWKYISTDHLGTPLLVTGAAGEKLWKGPFEPFGADTLRETPDAALADGLFLRLPGQWEDETWVDATLGADLFYNVHRWYENGTGRYSSVDEAPLPGPMDLDSSFMSVFGYASANPLGHIDPFGLASFHPNNRCRRRWNRKILPQLLKLPSKKPCRDFFCTELGTDLDHLVRDLLPIVVLTENLPGDAQGRNFCGLPDVIPYNRLPQVELRRPFFCNRPVKDVLNVVVHDVVGDQKTRESGGLAALFWRRVSGSWRWRRRT